MSQVASTLLLARIAIAVVFLSAPTSTFSAEQHPVLSMLSRDELPRDGQLIYDLIEQWNDQASQILTAKISYLSLITSQGNLQPLSPEEVEAVFEGVAFDKDPQVVFRTRVAPKLFFNQYEDEHTWLQESLFLKDGDKVRTDKWHGSHVVDGEHEIKTDTANDIVNVYDAGTSGWAKTVLEDFRFTPPKARWFRMLENQTNAIRLQVAWTDDRSGSHPDVVVNPLHGQIESYVERSADGSVKRQVQQHDFVTYASGDTFPRVVRDVRYSDAGVVSEFKLTVVTEAQFNYVSTGAEFTIPIRTQQQLVDFRDSKQTSPDSFRVKHTTADVTTVSRPKRHDSDSADLMGPSKFSLGNVLLFFNGLLLLVVGFRIVRRSRNKFHNSDSNGGGN